MEKVCGQDKACTRVFGGERIKTKQVLKECALCGKTFSRCSNLSRHMKISHSGRRFSCETCGRQFTCKEGLNHHRRVMHEGLRCSICFEMFDSVRTRDMHVCSGRRLSVGSVSCPICSKSFSCKSNLNKHQRVAHFGEVFTCATCSKVLRSRESMVEHNRSAHGLFVCSKCSLAFTSEELFAEHVATEHHVVICLETDNADGNLALKGERTSFKTIRKHCPVSCERCGKVFSSKSNLTKHIRFVHDKENMKCKPFSNNCDQQLPSRVKTVQNNSTTFRCTHCSLNFYKRTSLWKHQRAAHDRLVPDGGCQCEVCGKTFLYECNLKRHIKRDHEGKSFSCHVCDMQFESRQAAEEHQSQHENCTFTCTQCCKIFETLKKLRDHVRTSHRIRKIRTIKRFPRRASRSFNLQKNHGRRRNEFEMDGGETEEQIEHSLPNIDLGASELTNSVDDFNIFDLTADQDVVKLDAGDHTNNTFFMPSEQNSLFQQIESNGLETVANLGTFVSCDKLNLQIPAVALVLDPKTLTPCDLVLQT